MTQEADDYRGQHEAPTKEGNAPLHDVSLEGIYPEDFYSGIGLKHYAGDEPGVSGAYQTVIRCHNRPNALIKVYRAVPKGVKGIERGNWVTTVRGYAVKHGKENLKNNYSILSKTVHARDLFTDGNSLFEWGYDPQPLDVDEQKKRMIARRFSWFERMGRGEKIAGLNKKVGEPYYNKDPEFFRQVHAQLLKQQQTGEAPPVAEGVSEKRGPSAVDVRMVQKIVDDPKLPAVAEKGMAYVVRWADGRAVFALKKKSELMPWLRKVGEMAELISVKYTKAEHNGEPLKVESAEMEHRKSLLLEDVFTSKDLDLSKTYGIFKASYEKQTGKAWDKDKFLDRINGWTLYGDPDGFVAARQQASGPTKLVGAAGNPVGVKKGFQELLASNKPIWGAMDLRLATMAARMGMKMPPAWIMVKILNAIKDRFAQASGLPPGSVAVNKDGSLTLDYPDIGKATKFVIGNRLYFEWLLKTQGSALPAMLRTAISFFLTTGKPPPEPEGEDMEKIF